MRCWGVCGSALHFMLPRKRAAGAEVEVEEAYEVQIKKAKAGSSNSASSSVEVEFSAGENYSLSNGMGNGGGAADIDEDLHSRQLAVYGRETMRRLFASNVLISGLNGLGAEIAKNLALAGVKSITLHDEENVEMWDLSGNFFLSEDDVGKNRALSCVQKLQELNNAVAIATLTGPLSKEQLSDFQDDDTNYHMDMIAGLANMRARNYSIPEVDKLKAKFIAGRIIPAIATSTAMATGLVCLELYKVLDGGHKVEDYRNSFANLALPLFSMAEPVPPKVFKHQDMSWTVWDRWIVKGNLTLRELLKWLKDKGLEAYSISCGSSLLYNSMFPRHKDRMDKKVVDVAKEVAKLEVPPYRRHLDLVVACEDEDGTDVDIPQVSVYFR